VLISSPGARSLRHLPLTKLSDAPTHRLRPMGLVGQPLGLSPRDAEHGPTTDNQGVPGRRTAHGRSNPVCASGQACSGIHRAPVGCHGGHRPVRRSLPQDAHDLSRRRDGTGLLVRNPVRLAGTPRWRARGHPSQTPTPSKKCARCYGPKPGDATARVGLYRLSSGCGREKPWPLLGLSPKASPDRPGGERSDVCRLQVELTVAPLVWP
jgi:hypothetical protein